MSLSIIPQCVAVEAECKTPHLLELRVYRNGIILGSKRKPLVIVIVSSAKNVQSGPMKSQVDNQKGGGGEGGDSATYRGSARLAEPRGWGNGGAAVRPSWWIGYRGGGAMPGCRQGSLAEFPDTGFLNDVKAPAFRGEGGGSGRDPPTQGPGFPSGGGHRP